MKKIKLKKGLKINKEAINRLQESTMLKVVGGSTPPSCVWSSYPYTYNYYQCR